MNIVINASCFKAGHLGGVETYIRNLWLHLQQFDTLDSYEIYCARRYFSLFPSNKSNFSCIKMDCSHGSLTWLARGILRRTLDFDILKPLMRNVDADLIHHPFTVLTPLELDIPSVLTFWDMQQEYYPDFFSEADLKKRRKTYISSARKASRIIVSAEFTKQSLIDKYNISPGKIDVVYTGYGQEYRKINDLSVLMNVRDKYNLDAPFIFYPAATWPHKNHKNLLWAIKLMRERYNFDGQLVLTGIAMQSQNVVRSLIEDLALEDSVRILGYLPYEELPALFNLAQMMSFPSFFEGFGIPLVEAMACGCPVVCSNVTSIPEVVGNAAMLFDPNSVEDIAEKIWSVWNDESKRSQMRSAGLERAKLFSWDETARQTIAVYKKAIA